MTALICSPALAQELSVVAGPLESERRELLGMIKAAEKQGVNTNSFMANFKYVEDRVTHGVADQSIQARIALVKKAIEDQIRVKEFYKIVPTKNFSPVKNSEPVIADKMLTFEEARLYAVSLINADRAKNKLLPVVLDIIASRAAQKHTDEMAANKYMAHVNLTGKKPSQRYTESGGTSAVSENLALLWTSETAPITTDKIYSQNNIRKMQKMFMDEVPPEDLHRVNILRPEHNKVGIGLSVNVAKNGYTTISFAQEFVDAYGEFSKIPSILQLGKSFEIAGTLAPGYTLYDINICWEPLPKPMTVTELEKLPHQYTEECSDWVSLADKKPELKNIQISIRNKVESFTATVVPTAEWKPGLHFIQVFAHKHKERLLLISKRTCILNPSNSSTK